MTTQLALDYVDYSHVRASDPATSRDAAARASRFAKSHAATILEALRRHPNGLTAHEIASITSLNYVQVDRRFIDLERAGHAKRTEQTRGTPSGGRATVWVAV